MPDTQLAAIRERAAEPVNWQETQKQYIADRRALLAHIDALTAAVEALPGYSDNLYGKEKSWVDLADVLAILRGEQ